MCRAKEAIATVVDGRGIGTEAGKTPSQAIHQPLNGSAQRRVKGNATPLFVDLMPQ
ncbi:Uncharacterised protein [Chlamydia trachomatis]|nr:Uncharacterised protein [Chlamydia trachomatis]